MSNKYIMMFKTLILRENDPWYIFVKNLSDELLVYNSELGRIKKQELFKKNIKMVEFEPHAFCNRKCSFCPNRFIDRKNNKSVFNINVYKKIISDLQLINYDYNIRFSRYCEPLARDEIYDFIHIARSSLPNAKIDIITNSDYLKTETIAELKSAGLSTLRISVYPSDNSEWNHSNAMKAVSIIGQRIGLEPKILYKDSRMLRWMFDFKGMEIFAEAINLSVTGLDRGQALSSLSDNNYRRTTPCFFVFNNITVDYNGAVMPCCNLRSDFIKHEPFIIDIIDDKKTIFDIYLSEKFTTWRRSLVKVDEKKDPCKTCKHKIITDKKKLLKTRNKINNRLIKFGIKIG